MPGSVILLGRRSLFCLRGPDRVRYLNGQLTNDVAGLAPGRALHACVTDVKARLIAEVRVHDHADGLWVEAPAELHATLWARLDRYLVADDAFWGDHSTGWELVHLLGPAPDPGGLPAGAMVAACERLGVAGHDVWLPAAATAAGGAALAAARGRLAEDEAETLRILQRVPAWGRELVAGMLPPEAGLDRDAISYSKGCYLGQEVLSRIRSAGKLNRRLVALAVDPAFDPAALAGARLVAQRPGGQVTAGDLTSVAPLPPSSGEWRAALGFRNRTCEDAGCFDLLLADGTAAAAAARVR